MSLFLWRRRLTNLLRLPVAPAAFYGRMQTSRRIIPFMLAFARKTAARWLARRPLLLSS